MSLQVSLRHRFDEFELDIELNTGNGRVSALFGPSGCGKTTVINAVAGLLKPRQGRIMLDQRVLLDTASHTNVPPRKRRLGYVFQDARLFPHLSVKGNLLFGYRRAGRHAAAMQPQHVIDVLDIGHLLDRQPKTLSGGERQRVAIGRALLSAPQLLLLDEPLAALDHKRRDDILPYLERLREQQSVAMLYVSHSVDEVTRIADHVHVLEAGRVVTSGDVTEVFSRIDLFPLTGRFEAGALVRAQIHEQLPAYELTRVTFDGQSLMIPGINGNIGDEVRVRIRARDVLLTKLECELPGVTNVVAARVLDIRRDPGAFADVQLSCNRTRLVARVTKLALEKLGLKNGDQVKAVVKTVAIDQRSIR